jgi:hypothetical protein
MLSGEDPHGPDAELFQHLEHRLAAPIDGGALRQQRDGRIAQPPAGIAELTSR